MAEPEFHTVRSDKASMMRWVDGCCRRMGKAMQAAEFDTAATLHAQVKGYIFGLQDAGVISGKEAVALQKKADDAMRGKGE